MNRNYCIVVLLFLGSIFSVKAQDSLLARGNNFLNSGLLDTAAATFRAGIKAYPSNLLFRNQLALTLIQQKKYTDAQLVLNKVLVRDSNNTAAIWYSGMIHFYNKKDRLAIAKYEKLIGLIDSNSAQYPAINWYIGKCYSNLLTTDGLNYTETNRLIECLEIYTRRLPDAADVAQINEYLAMTKKNRPTVTTGRWVQK
jgi:tetratricopeptide (TPR) repeat protein